MSDQKIVENLEHVWHSIADLCASFTEREWKMPTDCSGWNVQDNLAHIVDFESRFLGRPVPEHRPREMSHIKNDLGRRNEIWVDWCRSWSGAQALATFQEVVPERLRFLRSMTEADFAAPSPISVRGESMRDHLQRRIVDCWAHEQDIRRAVSRPGHTEGPVVTHVLGRLLAALPGVVGQRTAAPPGSTVIVAITGAASQRLAVQAEAERAVFLHPLPETATVRLTMDAETFTCLAFGRWEAEKVLESGRVLIAGDKALGRAIVAQMNITP